MAVDIFLKLGDIKGESKDSVHKDEIEIVSWSFGAANAGSASSGGGMATREKLQCRISPSSRNWISPRRS